ncbi:(2Fe-2S)-binding protein [Vibrio sp. HN007]|uniref:(2Fe-2S)-binding protein n=1 Tax=Vibrio iocasae TaxID=3098914 RepID=UPI0035D50599
MDNIQQQFKSLLTLPENTNAMSIKEQQQWLNTHNAFFRLNYSNTVEGANALLWFENHFSKTINSFAKLQKTKTPVASSVWQKTFNASVFTSLTAHRVVFNKVPKLSLADLSLSIDDAHRVKTAYASENPEFYTLDTNPDNPKAITVRNQDELDSRLVEVIKAIAEPLLPHFKEQKVGNRVFWGNTLYACSLAFTKLAPTYVESEFDVGAMQEWQAQLSDKIIRNGHKLNQIKKVHNENFQKLFIRRETCCLKYKIAGKAMCKTCNLYTPEEQEELFKIKNG